MWTKSTNKGSHPDKKVVCILGFVQMAMTIPHPPAFLDTFMDFKKKT